MSQNVCFRGAGSTGQCNTAIARLKIAVFDVHPQRAWDRLNVSLWHKADMAIALSDVCFWG